MVNSPVTVESWYEILRRAHEIFLVFTLAVTPVIVCWFVCAYGTFLRLHCSVTVGLVLVVLYVLPSMASINHVELKSASDEISTALFLVKLLGVALFPSGEAGARVRIS